MFTLVPVLFYPLWYLNLTKIFPTLTHGWEFDLYFGYEIVLKLVTNVYHLNGSIEHERLIIKLTSINTLGDKKVQIQNLHKYQI